MGQFWAIVNTLLLPRQTSAARGVGSLCIRDSVSFVDVNLRSDGTRDKNPFDLDAGPITQGRRVLKPILLYNEVQTEGYVSVPPNALVRSDVRKLLEPFFPFCTHYLEKWKAHPENRKKPISPQEEVFVTRFAADILVVGSNLLYAHEIPKPYPSHAFDAIGDADCGRVMKLAGIAQELACVHNACSYRHHGTDAPSTHRL